MGDMPGRNNLEYAVREIENRPLIYAINVLGIAITVALLITLSALSTASREAAMIPLEEVGADIIVQKYGSVPKAVSGPILSCSLGPIRQNEINRIRQIDGVQDISPALLIWVFDRDYFKIVTGIEKESLLGKLLAPQVVEGEFISGKNRTAVLEKNFALMHGISLNDVISIDSSNYTVIGILNAQGKDRIGAANILISMQDSQELAYNAKNIQNTVRFNRDDVNLLFLMVDQDKTISAQTRIEGILGKNSRVSSMSSFLPQLSSITTVAGSFSTVTSLIAIIVAVLLLFKITAVGILQRRTEIGIMKAVGWTGKDVRNQFIIESLILGIAGGIAGIFLGLFAVFLLGMVDIAIPVSQDLASDPFLSSGLQRHVSLPIAFPATTGIISFGLAVIIGVAAGVLASRRISSISPAEVLKNE